MTTTVLPATPASKETLAHKLEFAILSVLAHYNGVIEESLVEWYSALRLGLPQLTDQEQLWDVFKSLSATGIIEVDTPDDGLHRSHATDDDGFSGESPFLTTLTPTGLVHWNTVRVQPQQTAAF